MDAAAYARICPLVPVTRRVIFSYEWDDMYKEPAHPDYNYQEECYEEYACGHRDFLPAFSKPAKRRRCFRCEAGWPKTVAANG